MAKRRILIHLDVDAQPSTFDRVVAVDAGVDELFSYGSVEPEQVEGLVHGAMFTRGPADLKSTAFFIGGKSVVRAEETRQIVEKTFFGPVRCSLMLDPNGANTTAAAAVVVAGNHLDLSHTAALVLGGTGPVGQRVALLLARQGAAVWIASRSRDRAADICESIEDRVPNARVFATSAGETESISHHPERFQLVVSAAAAGVRTVSRDQLAHADEVRVLMDLNAVPPTGIEEVDVMDNGREEAGRIHYGAIGVGGLKMKIHKLAIAALFERNDQVLDAESIYDLGAQLKGNE